MNEYIKTIIKIFFLIIVIIILFSCAYYIDPSEKKEEFSCDLNKLNIDDMVIINRNPEYIKYINKLIDEKKFMFTDKQLEVLKNPNQFYLINKSDGSNDVNNISYKMYKNCAGQFDTPVNSTNSYFDGTESSKSSDSSSQEQLEINSSKEYNKIIQQFEKNITNTLKPDCTNSCVMSDPKYLKNYYLDMWGNRVMANLTDYFADYYTNINTPNPTEAIPVTTQKGTSEFIIPDQYPIQNYFTNAYNVDWSRVVNPYTIY